MSAFRYLVMRASGVAIVVGLSMAVGLIIGLILSVAMMGAAANIIAKYIERYRWIAYFGLIVILYVAVKMVYEGVVDHQVGILTLL